MIILITGGSGSGKSEYAENLAVRLCRKDLLYIATMMPYDEECRQRIIRHQNQRKGKGFQTLECYTKIKELKLENTPTVLLECMSNLLANEMFSIGVKVKNEETGGKVSVCDDIMEGITHLEGICEHVIIVSNEVFSDNGSSYEETTNYINSLGEINCRIGSLADYVYEVVCGIPVCQKGSGVI